MMVFLSGERPGDKPMNALGSLLSATALKRPASRSTHRAGARPVTGDWTVNRTEKRGPCPCEERLTAAPGTEWAGAAVKGHSAARTTSPKGTQAVWSRAAQQQPLAMWLQCQCSDDNEVRSQLPPPSRTHSTPECSEAHGYSARWW